MSKQAQRPLLTTNLKFRSWYRLPQQTLRMTQLSFRLKSAMSSDAATRESSSPAPQSIFELGNQLQKQSDIIESIKTVKKDILQKQSVGRQLALNVADTNANLEEHLATKAIQNEQQNTLTERKQRFHMFVDKMQQLYKNEKRLSKLRNQAYAKMEMAPVQSNSPVKFCLQEYSKISTRGWSCEVLAESLKRLNQTVAAIGNKPLLFNDLSLSEMDQSWRLDKVTEDIRFGLDPNPNVFFSPYNLAKVARELGTLGYKNTDLMPLWFDKIDTMLGIPTTKEFIQGAEVSFEQARFGGHKNFVPRHYIYQGFSGSQEFEQHVQTLLEYQQYKKEQAIDNTANVSQTFKEVKNASEALINAAKEVKDMQQEMEAAVRNVRNQYAKLKEAHDEHAFLKEHQYISLDLMELQELLIKAGYMMPDEQVISNDLQIGALGMDAAVEVFYDMVLNFYPQTLSPQYDNFYRAAVENSQKSAQEGDLFTKLNLHTLSSTLVGLEHQAMSYRRDIADRDYPTEFYEKLALPEEDFLRRMEGSMPREQKEAFRKTLSTHVRMERTYLNAWQTFYERTKNIPAVIEGMLNKKNTYEDLFSGLRALNVCRFQAEDLRDKISKQFVRVAAPSYCDPQALVDGAVGLAGCSYKPVHAAEMTQALLSLLQKKPLKTKKSYRADRNLKVIDTLSFAQAIELLKALTTLGMASSDTLLVACVKDLLRQINSINFDIIGNELTHREFHHLYDAYVNLKFSEVKSLRKLWMDSFQQESLRRAFEQREISDLNYVEHLTEQYDPIKPRVMKALSESFLKADLKDLHFIQENQTKGMEKKMFPYAPDILMSHGGQKVGVFILNDDNVMRDTKEACGFMAAKIQLIRQAHELAGKTGTSALKGVALPIQSVVNVNLAEQRLKLRTDFSLKSLLEKCGLDPSNEACPQVDTSLLTKFSKQLTERAAKNYQGTSAAFEEFLLQLLTLMQKRERLDSVFEQEQVLAAIDELKLQMLKLVALHVSTLSLHEQQLVADSLPRGFNSFESMIQDGIVAPMKKVQKTISKQTDSTANEAQFWEGVRQEVEMPLKEKQEKLAPKSILPELLNHRFLWYDKYHQYADWEQTMRAAYDQLNLMELPSKGKDQSAFFFNKNDFQRRVPKGIFPDARKPRIVLRPPGTSLKSNHLQIESQLDHMTKFERQPIQTMLQSELARNSELARQEVSDEVKIITNLQSIKHSLKSDLADHQICDFLFNKLTFTDKLIEAHLGLSQKTNSVTDFVKRDAKSYRNFVDEQMRLSQTHASPFDHFYMQEAARKGNPEELAAKIFALEDEHLVRPRAETKAMKEQLYKQIEDLLLNYERANEDPFVLSKAMDSKVEVTIDVDSLTPVSNRNNYGLSPVELEMHPEQFLKKERCRAEANLIKARITYKVHSDIALTENETKYLNAWIKQAAAIKTLLPQADLMVPETPSTLSLAEAFSPEDFYLLNSLSRVSITGKERERIALNDLVLELALFVDSETVRKVELGLLEDSLKKEWGLAEDFTLVDRRNKEIDLVMREMEEVAWRASGQFDERERKHIENLAFLDRGSDTFDNAFLDMDRASFDAFFNEANFYDSRITLLENWLCRKDQEVRQRVNLPPAQMIKSDQEIFAKQELPIKKAREKLVGQMLITDEFGNSKESKAYSELTTRELHILAESLSIRLNLFAQKYPAFLPQVIRAVMEHKNLAGSDRSMLNTYCKLFELDWRGDESVTNREQFMLNAPIYMHEKDRLNLMTHGPVSNESVLNQIKQACQPYLPDLLIKMRKLGQ